ATFAVEPEDTGSNLFAQCFAREEIARPDRHYVPHYLEGQNPFIGEHAERLGIPVEATLGGAETALPEYRDRLRAAPPASTAPRGRCRACLRTVAPSYPCTGAAGRDHRRGPDAAATSRTTGGIRDCGDARPGQRLDDCRR